VKAGPITNTIRPKGSWSRIGLYGKGGMEKREPEGRRKDDEEEKK